MDERRIAIELDRVERRLGEALEAIRMVRHHLETATFAAAEPFASARNDFRLEEAPRAAPAFAPPVQLPEPPAPVERRSGRDRRSGVDRRQAVLDGLAARIILATARDRRNTDERRSGVERRHAAAA